MNNVKYYITLQLDNNDQRIVLHKTNAERKDSRLSLKSSTSMISWISSGGLRLSTLHTKIPAENINKTKMKYHTFAVFPQMPSALNSYTLYMYNASDFKAI